MILFTILIFAFARLNLSQFISLAAIFSYYFTILTVFVNSAFMLSGGRRRMLAIIPENS